MGILDDLRARVQAVNDGLTGGATIREVVQRHGDDIMELQKIQLLQGLSSSGEDIRPFYSEDLQPAGYFKSRESAGRYAAWKQTLNYPYSVERRNADAPNLYVNGRFHSELGVQFGADAVAVMPETGYAAGIVAKYGIGTFGLMAANWNALFTERGALDELMIQIKSILYV